MPRRMEATRDAVWEAMVRLKTAGDPRWDSPGRLRVAIGSVGSLRTIVQHRDAWRAEHEAVAAADTEAPVEVPPEARDAAGDAISRAVEHTWRTARDHAAAATAEARRKAAEDVSRARRDRDDALDDVKRLEMDLAEADTRHEEARGRIKKLDELNGELVSGNAALRGQVDQALTLIRQGQEAAAAAAEQREADHRAELQIAAEREAKLEAELAELRGRVAAAEEAARQGAAEADRRREDERTAHASEVASVREEHRRVVARLEAQATAAQGMIGDRERLIDGLRKELDAARTDCRKKDEEIASTLRKRHGDQLEAREAAIMDEEKRVRQLEAHVTELIVTATTALAESQAKGSST